MRVSDCIRCEEFPCSDVDRDGYSIPSQDVNPNKVSLVMIAEAAPPDPDLAARTTLQAFEDAREKLTPAVYLTTAVKCAKTAYTIAPATIRECSRLLDKELSLFPKTKVLMLMGDAAIKALNFIAGKPRVIPAGSTYKLRGAEYFFRGMRVFPSYLQAGPSFFIEKSKRRMIAEDIAAAMRYLRAHS